MSLLLHDGAKVFILRGIAGKIGTGLDLAITTVMLLTGIPHHLLNKATRVLMLLGGQALGLNLP